MTSFFARLKFAHKLLICSAVFSLPLGVLLYYTVTGFQHQLEFTEREIAGARALQPLCRATILISQRQVDTIAATVDALFGDIRKSEERVGPLLPASVDSSWNSLKASDSSTVAGEGVRAELLMQLHAAFPRLAETANLILDPDLDSYYLAELALIHVPDLLRALGHGGQEAIDPGPLKAIRHAVSVAAAENRRKHPGSSLVATELPRVLTMVETAAPGTKRLEAVSALWQASAAELAAVLEQRAAALRLKEMTALVLTLVAVVLAGTMLFIAVRNLSVPLAGATLIADQIAAGRLNAAAASLSRPGLKRYLASEAAGVDGQSRDEAARLLNSFGTMANNLGSLLGEVRTSCVEVGGATSQVTAAMRLLEATVTEQAASTNQVVATSQEIFATVQDLARSMRTVSEMAAEAAGLASTGLEGLNDIKVAMQDTLEGAAEVSSVLDTISTNAANINYVLGTITNIANRTNLISLNAAIEAEKAGEHAAGFTAVSLEIRRLADQTAVAALEIEKLLGDMNVSVGRGIRSMADYTERLRGNCEAGASVTAGLGRSIECTRKLEPHFEAVNSGMQAQAQAARQIVEAMRQLSDAAGQTRDSLAQFQEIAEHMQARVEALQAEVARFSVA